MKSNSASLEATAKVQKNDPPQRFTIFVARGERPLVSFSDFSRAERLAIIFARITNAQMEVFDSEKEVCYYISPNEAKHLSTN